MANTKNAYNDVEITEEEVASLYEKGEQTTMSEKPKEEVQVDDSTNKESIPEDKNSDDFEYQLEIDGNHYSVDEVVKWKKDADNKADWSKSNTEKSQKIAGVGKFLQKFKDDKDLRDHLKGYFKDDKEFNSYGLDSEFDFKDPEQVKSESLEERLNKLEEFEQSRVVDQRTDILQDQLSSLEGQYPNILGNPEQVMKFLDFSERNSARYRDKNGVVKLSDAFREYSFDALNEELRHYKHLDDNKQKNDGSVVTDSEIGAKDVQTPKHIKAWKDIDPHDKEFKQYFDE